MLNSHYLYGEDFDATLYRDLSPHQYFMRKIIASEQLVIKLLNAPIESRDFVRINKSLKSQVFNKKMIDELYGKDVM